jgi:AraC family transcriptional regulator
VRSSALASGVYFGRAERARRAGSLALCRTTYAPRERIPAHAHGEAYLCLALAGSFRERSPVWKRGEELVVPGSVVLHRPGEVHEDRFGDEPGSCLNVALSPVLTERVDARLAHEGPARYGAPGAVGELVWRLAREFDAPDEASELAIEGLTLELLAFFVRADRPRDERREPRWMPAVLERLRAERSLSLTVLAGDACIHPSTLARTFRRLHGCSVGEYRRRWRVARACAALRSSDLPLAEIAAREGFADQSHFTRAVRAAVGLSPAAYRRAARR